MLKKWNGLPMGDKIYYVLTSLFIFAMVIVTLFPLYFILIASFSSPNDVMLGKVILLPSNVTLKAYNLVFKNQNIWNAYGNTVVYTLAGTAFSLIATLTAAFVFSRKGLIGSRVCMLMIIFTMYFSGGLIPTYFNIRNLGMLNTIWALIIPGMISGYNLIIARTFMQTSIPDALDEAAKLDGCTPIRFFLEVVIPLSTPIIGVLCLYSVVGHWNSYYSALIYMTERKNYPLQLILREILVQGTVSNESMDAASMEEAFEFINLAESLKYALVIVSSVPMLILYPFLQKFFVKGVMIGSVKG